MKAAINSLDVFKTQSQQLSNGNRTMFSLSSPNRNDGVLIEAHWSTERLTYILTLRNSQGEVFRIYHPETWQYLSLERRVAEYICQGFPEYWENPPDEELLPCDVDHRVARGCRSFGLKSLFFEKFPITTVFNDPDRRPYWSEKSNEWLNSLKTCNPFSLLYREVQCYKAEGVDHVPDARIWRYWALELFRELALSAQVQRCPSALRRPADSQLTQNDADEGDSSLPDDITHERGRSLASQGELQQAFCRSAERPVQWGPLFYEEATVSLSHFCVSGVTRSGKTTLLRLLFQSLHQDVVPQPRFVLYDAKPDLLPRIFPPGSLSQPSDDQVAEAVYLLSPFDQRGTAWDIAADAAKESTAAEIAEILFPSFDGSNEREFYGPAVRDVTTELMVALTRTAAQKWTFYDLLCAMQLDNIPSVLCSTPNGRRLYALYFEGKKSNVPEDLPKALRTKSAKLLRAAYAWSHAERRIALREWVRSQNKTVVLFNDDEHLEANTEINRVLLNLLAQILLAVKNPPARTYVYLDEMEHLGFIKPMTRLIEKGADLKVNLAIAFHDLLTLKKVYGESTEGVLSQASFQAFLKVNSQASCEWASYQIGTPEVKVTSTHDGTSYTSSGDGDASRQSQQTSQSKSDNYASRRLVIPDEIRDLPLPAQAKKLSGYFVAPIHSPYLGTLPASKVIRSRTEYLAAEQSEENFYALWPTMDGVSEHCPQPDELYELPDDMFRTLYDLGFRKPGYPQASSPPPPSSDIPPASDNPPSSTKPLPPADDALPEKPKADNGPTDVDDDVDIPDIDFGDE